MMLCHRCCKQKKADEMTQIGTLYYCNLCDPSNMFRCYRQDHGKWVVYKQSCPKFHWNPVWVKLPEECLGCRGEYGYLWLDELSDPVISKIGGKCDQCGMNVFVGKDCPECFPDNPTKSYRWDGKEYKWVVDGEAVKCVKCGEYGYTDNPSDEPKWGYRCEVCPPADRDYQFIYDTRRFTWNGIEKTECTLCGEYTFIPLDVDVDLEGYRCPSCDPTVGSEKYYYENYKWVKYSHVLCTYCETYCYTKSFGEGCKIVCCTNCLGKIPPNVFFEGMDSGSIIVGVRAVI
jgi:hypothetical protein